jgi:ribosomal protein S17E
MQVRLLLGALGIAITYTVRYKQSMNNIGPTTLFIIRTDAIVTLKSIRARIAGYETQMFMAEKTCPEAMSILQDRIRMARREERGALELLEQYE